MAVGASIGLTLRVARRTVRSLRDLHVTLLEVKRRVSVATVDEAGKVSFAAGGDPEGYGDQKAHFIGADDLLAFLLNGTVKPAKG